MSDKELKPYIDKYLLKERIEALEQKLFENSGDLEIIKNHAEQIAELKDFQKRQQGFIDDSKFAISDNTEDIEKLESVLIKIRDILNEVFKNGD